MKNGLTGSVGALAMLMAVGCACPSERAFAPVTPRERFRAAVADPVTRRTALADGLRSGDSGIRRAALCRIAEDDPAAAVAAAQGMTGDPSEEVRSFLVELSGLMADKAACGRFLDELEKDASGPVMNRIERRRGFPFHRENIAFSRDPANDHDMRVTYRLDLPAEGWKMAMDERRRGHLGAKPYFAVGFDDSSWTVGGVGFWEDRFGVAYDGIGWYRLTFELPERPADLASVELCFDGVDEEAWVWLNGKYVGQHCEGTGGYNRPFRFGIGAEANWGGANVLAVRVSDTAMAGGIWKGVRVEGLK